MEPSPPRKRRVPSGMEIVTSAFLLLETTRMSVFRSGLLNRRILKKVPRVQLSPSPPIWFRVRVVRCGPAKPATLVQIQSEPQNLRRWQNWLCTTLSRGTMRVRVPFFAHVFSRMCTVGLGVGLQPSKLVTLVQVQYGAPIFAPKACVVMRQFRKLEKAWEISRLFIVIVALSGGFGKLGEDG